MRGQHLVDRIKRQLGEHGECGLGKAALAANSRRYGGVVELARLMQLVGTRQGQLGRIALRNCLGVDLLGEAAHDRGGELTRGFRIEIAAIAQDRQQIAGNVARQPKSGSARQVGAPHERTMPGDGGGGTFDEAIEQLLADLRARILE